MPPAKMGRPSLRFDAEKVDSQDPRTVFEKRDSQDPRTVFDRLQALEQEIQEVKQRMERMEGQLQSLDSRVGGGRSRAHETEKGQPFEKR